MTKEDFIKNLSAQFNDKKPEFIADVRAAVSTYIEAQGKGCLTLIERTPEQNWRWDLSADPSYIARLIAFCREKTYDGHVIDSGLTTPVVEIVTEKFEKLYEKNSDEIAEAALRYIMEDKVLAQTLVDTIVASAAFPSAAVRNRAASLILEQLHHFMQTSAGHTITNFVGKTVATTASKPVGIQIAALIVKSLSVQMKVIIAKVLASGALKGAIAAAVKKFVIFAVAGAVVKAVAAKFGISTAAAFMWILLPLVAAYIIYEISTFPKHLAEKVSAKVADDLSGKYSEVNAEIFDKIIGQIINTGIAVMVRPLADSAEVQGALREIAWEL